MFFHLFFSFAIMKLNSSNGSPQNGASWPRLVPVCSQGKELLTQKIPVWQQACAEPTKLPDRAMYLAQQMSGAVGGMPPGALHPGISEPISGAKPLPIPPELAAFRAGGSMGQQVSSPCGLHQWMKCSSAFSAADKQVLLYTDLKKKGSVCVWMFLNL